MCPIECSTITYNKHIIFDGAHEHNIGGFYFWILSSKVFCLEQLRKLNGKAEDDDDDFVPSKFQVPYFMRFDDKQF